MEASTAEVTEETRRAQAMGLFFKELKTQGFNEQDAVMLTAQAYEIGHLQRRPAN